MAIGREMRVALGLAIIIISGSLYVSASNDVVDGEVVAVNTAPERTYIPAPDADGDGVSDWAEELLADREAISAEIDPAEPYMPPTTLTEKFSIKFFQDYLYSKGLGTFTEDKDALINRATEVLKDEATDRLYTIDDLNLSTDDSPEALRAYGNRLAEISVSYDTPYNVSELDVVERALKYKDPIELEKLDPIINAYRTYVEETLATPVPPSFIKQHGDLVNVYNAILSDLIAMRGLFEDPLLGLLRFKRYQDDVEGMVYVIYSIDRSLTQAGITYEESEPGFAFSKLGSLRDVLKNGI